VGRSRAQGDAFRVHPDGLAQPRGWVAEVVEQATVHPAVRGRNFFTPDRVEISWRGERVASS
jgi:hypothetical protein